MFKIHLQNFCLEETLCVPVSSCSPGNRSLEAAAYTTYNRGNYPDGCIRGQCILGPRTHIRGKGSIEHVEGVRPDFRIKVSPLSGSGQSMFLFVVQICVIKGGHSEQRTSL